MINLVTLYNWDKLTNKVVLVTLYYAVEIKVTHDPYTTHCQEYMSYVVDVNKNILKKYFIINLYKLGDIELCAATILRNH